MHFQFRCYRTPVFAAGLFLLSMASGLISLAAAWTVIGIGMGFGLYEASFATVTGLWGREARNAITGITLFAGFASTIGWPLSALYIDAFGWRGACLAWAAMQGLRMKSRVGVASGSLAIQGLRMKSLRKLARFQEHVLVGEKGVLPSVGDGC
jgi:hypothetical protein